MLFSAAQTLIFSHSHRWALKEAIKSSSWCHGGVVCHKVMFDPDGCIYNRSSAARQFHDEPQLCNSTLTPLESFMHDYEYQPANIAIVVTKMRTNVECA